jgi:hypothetical protein
MLLYLLDFTILPHSKTVTVLLGTQQSSLLLLWEVHWELPFHHRHLGHQINPVVTYTESHLLIVKYILQVVSTLPVKNTSLSILIFFIVESGALYCGSVTTTQIAASITSALNSQNSP